MFCPKCKAEYNEGVQECADCGVPLVDVLPQEHKKRYVEYVSIVQTLNPSDIAMIESVLEGSGIDYFIQGENTLSMMSYILPVRVLVLKEQMDEARELLKDLDLSINVRLAHDGRGAGASDEETSEVENGEDET